MLKVRERTLLFTEQCPLDCRYCFNKAEEEYMCGQQFDITDMIKEIDGYLEKDKEDKVQTQILFTGGEPFLYWKQIKEIIEKYGHQLFYKFNTNGMLLTKEIIEFLSDYHVIFVLSVDGDHYLTNYLRPNKRNKYRVGYLKELRKILPYLLYYFPATQFKIIIGPRYVDKLYESYLFAEQIGFKEFFFILDFNSRPYTDKEIIHGENWTDECTEKLTQQLYLITQEMVEGWRLGLHRPQIRQIDMCVWHLLTNPKFDPHNFPCGLLNGRSLKTVYSLKNNMCMSQYFDSYEELEKELYKQYEETNGLCPIDPECPAFEYCAVVSCPKNSMDQHGKFFYTEALECAVNKSVFKATFLMLATANEVCPNSIYYKLYLREKMRGEF